MSELTEQIRATCDSIAENQKKVYDLGFEQGINLGGYSEGFEAGKKSQYDEFWDSTANETSWAQRFSGRNWNATTFRPPYNLNLSGNCFGCFYLNNAFVDLVEWLEELGTTMSTTGMTNAGQLFTYSRFSHIGEIDLTKATQTTIAFGYMSYLKKIDKLKVSENTPFSSLFTDDSSLEELVIEGVIAKDGFGVSSCIKLSKASWISIMTAASTTASITITGSLISVNKAFETSEGANDGSTSSEWLALKAARPTVSVSLV